METLTEPIQVEIVSYDCCRPADSTTPLSFDKLQQFPIKADPELYEYFKIPDSFKDLIDAVGNIHVEFNETEGNIIVWVSCCIHVFYLVCVQACQNSCQKCLTSGKITFFDILERNLIDLSV